MNFVLFKKKFGNFVLILNLLNKFYTYKKKFPKIQEIKKF